MFSLFLALSVIVPATANVVTIQIGVGDVDKTAAGQVIGSTGSLTSYVIDEIPGTIVGGSSTFYQTWVYPGGDYMSQGCRVFAPSSIECTVYMSDAGSGSTTVSHLPESSLTEIRALVVSITATNTGVRPETEVKTVTDSAAPASTTAEATEAGKAANNGDHTSTLTSGGVVATTSSSAAACLDRSWIGGAFQVVLAAF
ncbi:hypothetical protein N7491_011270 [Penicillium cf. griseofulvum]|uniref:Uncharacterized protein n=1 Tax=Penicillium cf. griseofulvum TaxID=2972120 RepID=A0A9W9MFW3_9EURO|nr:hypothetical protein N7472_004726 [Penicillium cf. griseofulvum]KAJ5416368.1 hypothetical protein N7491_011270 [Penicillium cf. griseofulvum]KAJ5442295.1 hypothetical protein N7445_005302 [Penicillium cf. griseofulvum]